LQFNTKTNKTKQIALQTPNSHKSMYLHLQTINCDYN